MNTLQLISLVSGWTYTFTWASSLPAQVYHSKKLKYARGIDINFMWLNLTGFFFLALSNFAFREFKSLWPEYEQRFGTIPTNVYRFNDLAFAVWAFGFQAFNLVQYYLHYKEHGISAVARPWKIVFIVLFAILLACFGIYYIELVFQTRRYLTLVDIVLLFGFYKAFLTTAKCVAQTLYLTRRKTLYGFSLINLFCDLVGAFFALLQLSVDSYLAGVYVYSNPLKLSILLITGVYSLNLARLLYKYGTKKVEMEDENASESREPLASNYQ